MKSLPTAEEPAGEIILDSVDGRAESGKYGDRSSRMGYYNTRAQKLLSDDLTKNETESFKEESHDGDRENRKKQTRDMLAQLDLEQKEIVKMKSSLGAGGDLIPPRPATPGEKPPEARASPILQQEPVMTYHSGTALAGTALPMVTSYGLTVGGRLTGALPMTVPAATISEPSCLFREGLLLGKERPISLHLISGERSFLHQAIGVLLLCVAIVIICRKSAIAAIMLTAVLALLAFAGISLVEGHYRSYIETLLWTSSIALLAAGCAMGRSLILEREVRQ